MTTTREDLPRSLSSVQKAFEVLTFIGQQGESELASIAAHTKYPKSTLLRLIQIMIRAGYLQRTQHGCYRVTLQVWRIGAGALDNERIHDRIIPVLQTLVKETGETAHYSIYESGYAVYIEKIDGLHPIRAYTSIGGRSPAYASATGKALLAWQDEEEIRRVGSGAQKLTSQTVVGIEKLLEHTKQIRRDGYSVNRGEWRAGVWGVGAPIFAKAGKVEGAIGISGPEDRISSLLQSHIDKVVAASASLSLAHGAL